MLLMISSSLYMYLSGSSKSNNLRSSFSFNFSGFFINHATTLKTAVFVFDFLKFKNGLTILVNIERVGEEKMLDTSTIASCKLLSIFMS